MAEYIKFRMTAAKAAVTMAFMALVGGSVGSAEAKQRGPSAKPASFSWGANYLKINGITGNTKTVFLKLDSALASLEHKLSTQFFTAHKINQTFLKIKSANSDFLKIRSANSSFLKITNANANFLKIEDANASFLKITDASNEFLKLGGTAANSSELGGLTPDAFVQGHANVISGMVTVTGDGKPHPLLQTPDGLITVSSVVNSDGTESLVIHNGTSSALAAVVDPTAVEYQLPAVQDTQIPVGNTKPTAGTTAADGSQMIHLQIFPGGSFRDVITLTFSSEPMTNGQVTAVGQMLIGLL
jgi:hypothetical protein